MCVVVPSLPSLNPKLSVPFASVASFPITYIPILLYSLWRVTSYFLLFLFTVELWQWATTDVINWLVAKCQCYDHHLFATPSGVLLKWTGTWHGLPWFNTKTSVHVLLAFSPSFSVDSGEFFVIWCLLSDGIFKVPWASSSRMSTASCFGVSNGWGCSWSHLFYYGCVSILTW